MYVLLDEGNGCPVASTVRPRDRLLVRLHASRLDDDLAGGASPDATVTLALRAQMLVRGPARRDTARAAQRVLATAMHASGAGPLPVPVCQDRVKDCSEEFAELIRRLVAAGPVSARGVARARVLLADASGPVYHRASTDDLRARVRDAADALSAA
jgi:hypothetical protein